MSDVTVEARVLTGLLEMVLAANFSAEEARIAAHAIRDGKIFAPVAHVLDVLGSSTTKLSQPTKDIQITDKIVSQTSSRKGSPPERVISQLFDDVKRRKITKPALFEILHAIDPSLAEEISTEASIREAITFFHSNSTSQDWDSLTDVINGRTELDPFLRGILRR